MLSFTKLKPGIFLLLLIPPLAVAQNVPPLDAYVQRGMEHNQAFIREQLSTNLQEQLLQEARGKYLPDITLDASYIWADGGRLITIPAGDLINPAYRGLNQVVGEDRFPTDIPNVSEQLLPNDFHETKIRLIQPILNTDIYYNYKAKKAQLSAQEAKQRAYENQLVKEIKVAYYNHLSARGQRLILEDTRTLLEELLRVSTKQVENNRATREVIYGAQAELSRLESQMARAEREENVSRIFFNQLIGRALEEEIDEAQSPEAKPYVFPDLGKLTTAALGRRSEINQLRYGLIASQAATGLSKSYIVPKINLVGDLGYQGFTYQFDDTQDFWFVQVGLTWPIFQGFQNRSRVQQSLLQERQIESRLTEIRDMIALEVAQAYYGLEEATKTRQARQAERQSIAENFRIIRKKYAQNQVPLVAFNEARNAFTTAQLQETIAQYTLKIREAELEAAIHLDD